MFDVAALAPWHVSKVQLTALATAATCNCLPASRLHSYRLPWYLHFS